MIGDAKSGAEIGREAEEAEETEETEEKQGRRFAASRLAFDDVVFSRIAPTTLARWAGVPSCPEVQEKDRGKTRRRIEFFSLELRGKEGPAK